MAKVYSPPAEVGDVPDFTDFDTDGRYDFEAHYRAERAWIETIAEVARKHHKGDVVGEVIYFPMGDGQAQYLIWNTNPCELVWLPVGDAWSIPTAHARGLRTSDVREMVKAERSLSELFGGK